MTLNRSMEQNDLLARHRIAFLIRVEFAVGDLSPQSTIRLITYLSEKYFSKPGAFHRRQILRQLPRRIGKGDHLHDGRFPCGDLCYGRERCKRGVVVARQFRLLAVSKSIETGTITVEGVCDPIRCGGLTTTLNLPSMIEDVNARIWRRGYDQLRRGNLCHGRISVNFRGRTM